MEISKGGYYTIPEIYLYWIQPFSQMHGYLFKRIQVKIHSIENEVFSSEIAQKKLRREEFNFTCDMFL